MWAALPVDTFPARAYPTKVILSSGAILVTGGVDANGNALSSAGLINIDGAIKLTTLSGPMAAARVGHVGAPANFPEGDGALLFGGLPPGATTEPVAERTVGQSFSQLRRRRACRTASTPPRRRCRTATCSSSAARRRRAPQQSGIVITPSTSPATVTVLPTALSVAREGHTASLTGNDLVVCGGADATGHGCKAPATCSTP